MSSEDDQHIRQVCGRLLAELEAETLDDALLMIARLKEKAGVLAAVQRLVNVKHYSELFDAVYRLHRWGA